MKACVGHGRRKVRPNALAAGAEWGGTRDQRRRPVGVSHWTAFSMTFSGFS